jgi:hypothetical protein
MTTQITTQTFAKMSPLETNMMQLDNQPVISRKRLWTGRTLTGLAAAFLLMDGVMKLFKPAPVLEATLRLGYPESVIVGLGILLTTCTILYLIPRTAIFGAILLTGYLGGAVATHLRVGEGWFPTLFPVMFGAIAWSGLWLRDDRLRELLPITGESKGKN